ncbi:MAG: ATP-grasp domain-containing protein [Gemmatimonadales bacterium]
MTDIIASPRRIGLLVGREWSWPPAFIDEVNLRDVGVTADFVKLGAPELDEQVPYDVVIDRISHEVPFYRTWLKHAALAGVTVINNPFMWTADDKFFGATLAEANGVRSPRTIALPNKEYVPGIKHDESLRNLVYPLDWERVIRHVGLPCVLKDAHGGGWRDVYVCHSLDELIHHYDRSGLLTMVVQEFIAWDEFVRCLCIGRQHILPIQYDPKERKYHVSDTFLSMEMRARIISQSRTLVRALGYDMNSIEWAIRDGVPYAIDFMNPAPDFDINSLSLEYFEWAVRTMADVAIELALEPRRAPAPDAAHLFAGRVFER